MCVCLWGGICIFQMKYINSFEDRTFRNMATNIHNTSNIRTRVSFLSCMKSQHKFGEFDIFSPQVLVLSIKLGRIRYNKKMSMLSVLFPINWRQKKIMLLTSHLFLIFCS